MASGSFRRRVSSDISWTEIETQALLEACMEWKTQYGPGYSYNWGKILTVFLRKLDRSIAIDKTRLVTKLSLLKMDYYAWKDLIKSPGFFCDPLTGFISATQSTWEAKITGGRRFEKFRTKPMKPNICMMCSYLFDDRMLENFRELVAMICARDGSFVDLTEETSVATAESRVIGLKF